MVGFLPPSDLEQYEYDPVQNIFYGFFDAEGLTSLEYDVQFALRDLDHWDSVAGSTMSSTLQRTDTIQVETFHGRCYSHRVDKKVSPYLPTPILSCASRRSKVGARS